MTRTKMVIFVECNIQSIILRLESETKNLSTKKFTEKADNAKINRMGSNPFQ